MEDLKQIQEFFSKPLEENQTESKFKKGDKITYYGNKGVVNSAKYNQFAKDWDYTISYIEDGTRKGESGVRDKELKTGKITGMALSDLTTEALKESKYPSSQYKWDAEHPYSFTIYLPDGDKHHTDFYDLESARQMKKVLDADREVYRMMKSPDGQFNDDIRSLEEDINDFSPMSYAKKVASGNMSIEAAMEETGFPYTKLVAMVKQLNPNFKMQFQENEAQFTDYSNNELAAHAKELSKQRADAASKGQNDLLSGINKEIEAATRELKKRSQKLKDLSRTDVNEAFGEQYYLRVRLKDSPEAMKAFDDFIGKNDFRINKGGDQFSTDDVKAGIKLYRHLTDRLVKVYDHNLPLEDKNLPVYEATKDEENKFHKKLDKLVHKTFGHSSDEKKKEMNEGAVEIMDAFNDVMDLVKKHSRNLSDDDSYALALKLKAWFNKNILDEEVKGVPVEKTPATITRKEWDKTPKNGKAILNGIAYIERYDRVIGTYMAPIKIVDGIEETTDYMKRRRAMDDYAVSKKDKPAKSYNPNPSGKTDYQKRREKDLDEKMLVPKDKIDRMARDIAAKFFTSKSDKGEAIEILKQAVRDVYKNLDPNAEIQEAEGYSKFLKDDPEHPGGKTKGLTPDVMNKILMKVVQDIEESRPGLWDNIRAKQERGEKPSRKGSKAYKTAVKAGKEINKAKN